MLICEIPTERKVSVVCEVFKAEINDVSRLDCDTV